ncbi:MAG: hypothetical protein WCE51_05305, partial [Chthoniobacterales bacterium]
DADAKKRGITDGIVTLHEPRHIDIAGDRAYVVVPADYTFKKKREGNKGDWFDIYVCLAESPAAVVYTRPQTLGRLLPNDAKDSRFIPRWRLSDGHPGGK